MLFDAIPAQLNKNASRYQVSSVLTNNRADNTLELIAELKDSKLFWYHTMQMTQVPVCQPTKT